MRITYVGHSAVLIELDGLRLLTDPVLRRRVLHIERRAPPVDLGRVSDIDVVVVSHAHPDHLDPPSLRSLAPRATVIVPRGARGLVARRGFTRVEEIAEGEHLSVGGLEIEATHADHRPGRLRQRGPAAIGFLVAGTKRLYFAGDTDLFPGMRDLAAGGLDVALLPVWGWGTRIGAGHLDPRRAAEALTLLEPRVAIPIHWGTYYPLGLRRFRPQLLTEPPRAFAREARSRAPSVEVRILAPGETTELTD
jgi:L-ascorbate metabolism protein UlaG (beta-lactamase superfamily)